MNEAVGRAAPQRTTYAVRGELTRDGEMVTGWCWSPERGHERLRVSLLIDGQIVGGTVAARLRGDLVRDGVCDGYHGFSLPLPDPQTGYSVIEAREAVTGQVFGRLLRPQMADIGRWDGRVRALQTQLGGLHRQLPAPLAGRLGEACAALGASLGGGTAGAAVSAGLRLPAPDRPAASILLYAGAGMHASLAPSVACIAPWLRNCAAELILADAGGHACASALADIAGLVYLRVSGSGEATRINQAAARARGAFLIVLRAEDCSASGTAALMAQAFPPGGTNPAGILPAGILIGGRAVALAWQAAMQDACAVGQNAPTLSGLTLAAPRAAFDAMSGLDPTMAENAEWAALDFSLRVRRQGGAVVNCKPSAAQHPTRVDTQVRRNFAARWSHCQPAC